MAAVRRQRRGSTTTRRGRSRSPVLVGLALLVVLLAWCMGLAEPVPPRQAAAVADRFVRQEIARGAEYLRAVGALPSTQIVGPATELLDPENGTALGYVYELDPVGYVVVTSDTRLTPVIAFSYTSDFSWDENPDNVLLHMLRYDLRLRTGAIAAETVAPEAAASNESDWQALISPTTKPRSGDAPGADPPGNGGTIVYGPWLTTYWDQGTPWNDDCPMDPEEPIPGTHRCVVGCTATALAQIINYWQFPTAVTFPASDNYTSVKDPGDEWGTRTIPIDATTASFAGLNYNGCNPSDSAMADLCFAAGVSVRMDYSSAGSSAHMVHWPAALAGNWSPWSPPPQRWGYASADLRSYAASYFGWGTPFHTTETSFYTQLSTTMTHGRPAGVWVSVSGGGGGHTIVADGWQSGGRVYHLNYGWRYHANGWYTMPTGMPDYGFVEAAVVNIYPSATNYTLTTEVTGSGSVSNLPAGTTHSAGTHVLVTATPSAGSVFDHWEGSVSGTSNPVRVIMDGNETARAVFQTSTTHWSDDMESGQNWTATGLWHMTQQKSHSTSHSQWYGQEGTGNYETGGRSMGTLTSPAIDVSGTSSVTISFWHWRSVFYYPPFAGSDWTYAEYALDGGGWTQFWYEDSQDPSQYAWQQVLYDVTTTGVSSMQVRFGFDTVAFSHYDDYPGWFIDDVGITSASADTTPPTPDPMTWSSAPRVTAATAISMTATAATDPSGVEYYFDETSGNPGGTDSGWQDSATYTDDGLSADTQYCYRVQARDKSAGQNATGWSSTNCATTGPPATAAVFRVTSDGTVLSDATVHAGTFASESADVAEWVPISEPVEPGDVVELDPLNPGSYRLSSTACSPSVAGVIATEPGMILGESEANAQRAVLALIGIVPVKVTDEGGRILPGDLLVTSSTPGHAMRWDGKGSCAFVGKALEPMTDPRGLILVLLTSH